MENQIQTLINEQQAKVARLQTELVAEQQKLANLEASSDAWARADAAQAKIEEGERELKEAIALMPPEIAAMFQGNNSSLYPTSASQKNNEIADEELIDDESAKILNTPANNDTNIWTPVNSDYIADTRKWAKVEDKIGDYEVYLREGDGQGVTAIALISDNAQSWVSNEYHARRKFAVSAAKDFLLDKATGNLGDQLVSQIQKQIDETVNQPEPDWVVIDDPEEHIADEEKWFCYDLSEFHEESGFAVYFRYGDEAGTYSAIALIMEGESKDPRSWAIESVFGSQESAFLEAQDFIGRVLEGEFEDSNPWSDGEIELKNEDKYEKDSSVSEEVLRAIAKVKKGQKIDRIGKDVLQDAANILGVSPDGTKKEIEDAIRNSEAVKNGVVISDKFILPGDIESKKA